MSGKFMKVKKVMLPTLTVLLIASQLCGCAAANESELLKMINNQQTIAVEVPSLYDDSANVELEFDWAELAFLETYPEFRLAVEDILNITAFGQGGKNGTIYVDYTGRHTNNSNLQYAFLNAKFRDQLADTDTMRSLLDETYKLYSDIGSDAEAKLAFYNAYFNIINDVEPNKFAGSNSLTRAEFYEAVVKASNGVFEMTANSDLVANTGLSAGSEEIMFTSQILDRNAAYLDLSEKSLNDQTINGNITRAEAIYTLVKTFYSEDYDALTDIKGKGNIFSDAKDGGKIAEEQKFIEVTKDKKTKTETRNEKTYWKSYELQYAIDNADKGLPTDLYKALIIANEKGIITGSETRWDQSITKAEALNFLVRVFDEVGTLVNVDRGEGQVIEDIKGTGVPADMQNKLEESNVVEGLSGRLALPNNVTITSWGTNEFTGHKKALECTYSDEWAGAVMDVINTLQDGYIETLSEEKLDELIGTIALDAASIHGEDADDEEVTSTITEVFKVFRYLNAKAQQKENIDKIDQATGNQGSGGNQSSSGNGGGQSSNGTQNQGGGNQSQGGNSGQQNKPPADQGPVDQGPAPDGAGGGIPFGKNAPSNDKKGEFNEVPGLVVQ